MKSFHQQSGLTAISIVMLLAVGAFFILIGLRLVPIYLENFKVASHLDKIAHDPEIKSMSENEIVETLLKRLDIDDVENVTEDNVAFERTESGVLMISVDYEVRTPTVGNVDIVASFSEKAEIPR